MTNVRAKEFEYTQLLTEQGIHVPSQTIILTGEVGENMYEQLMMGMLIIENAHGAKTDLTVELNSVGGCWYNGIGIYDRLKAFKYPVTVKVYGAAMSMGSVILQAGDKRLLGPHSTVMIHDGEDGASGSPTNVLEWAKHGQKICDSMYAIYADASGKTAAHWKKKCKKDFILTAEQAIKAGLADGYV